MGKIQRSTQNNRVLSLDALRGFNMFWIIGGEKLADGLARLKFPGAHFVAVQLNHSDWNGFTFYDLIYPMFIFVAGVSVAFSIKRHLEQGDNPIRILGRILKRTLLLFLLGVYMSNSGLDIHGWLTNIRWMGVLQRIALCYCGTAIMVLFIRVRHQAAIAVAILIAYWLLLKFTIVPGFGAGVWNPPEANFANYFDRLFLPGRLYYDTWDVQGLLSTFPALVTCQMGVFSGFWLRKDWKVIGRGKPIAKKEKAILLALAGILLVGLGILWGLDFPINKKIWTSSFVLLTGGLSTIIMALFYWIIDIVGYKKWAFPFIVIGLNSIFIYLAMNIIPFDKILNSLFGRELTIYLGAWQTFFLALSTLAAGWFILYLMYKRKIFLRL
jgi:predicted acyltransferase